MSKLGKKSIALPQGVTVAVQGGTMSAKGPNGDLSRPLPPGFVIEVGQDSVIVKPPAKIEKRTFALWGTTRQHLANMIEGVARDFEKVLEFEGIGFRAESAGGALTLSVGFTHSVRLEIPEGLTVTVEKNSIFIRGRNKESVGQFAAIVRRVRPPEPYKGTGIRYRGEVIRRKAGKKLAGAAAA